MSLMSMQETHQTAPTEFIDADGIRFAYRRVGAPSGLPRLFAAALPRHYGQLGSDRRRRTGGKSILHPHIDPRYEW
jgi:hypothetical protein